MPVSKLTPNYYTILASKFQDSNELDHHLILAFKKLTTTMRINAKTDEYPANDTPMTLLFPFLRQQIIKSLLAVSPQLPIITTLDIYHFKWWTAVFDRLNMLASKDMLLWFCFHIPYYDSAFFNYPDKLEILQTNYCNLLEYASRKWLVSNYFTEDEFLFVSNETCFPYAASYYWSNNRELLNRYCRLLRVICGSWINYNAPQIATTRPNSKIRICFVSDSLVSDSSVFRDRAALIGKLDKSKFEVYIASFVELAKIKHKIASKFISKLGSNYIYLGGNITSARQKLQPYNFDILFYPDIGMKVRPTLLAYSRIAQIQINTWGHSETSGINTIDYFISSKYFELDSTLIAQEFYSEKLVMMHSLSTYYVSPSALFLDSPIASREIIKTRLGFQQSDRIYGCLQTFYKISPDMIKIFAGILRGDSNAVLVLSNCYPYPKSLAAQLITAGGEEWSCEFKKRIRWFPPLDKRRYLELVSICDIHLDPTPFGGCNTSYDAFDFNIPVITLPTSKISGRFTFGLYKKMDFDTGVDVVKDVVATTPESYISKAIETASNLKLRNMISRKIETGKRAIFMCQDVIVEYENLLVSLATPSKIC
jgi:predicted O-linked N-acetylglucosamine transferase (SPINDLY family)